MGTPICGVLLLDPSPRSPLKLDQRWGAGSVCVERASACDQEEPRQLTRPVNHARFPRICSRPSPRVGGTKFRQHTHAARNVGAEQ